MKLVGSSMTSLSSEPGKKKEVSAVSFVFFLCARGIVYNRSKKTYGRRLQHRAHEAALSAGVWGV